MKLRRRPIPFALLLVALTSAVTAADQIQNAAPALPNAGLVQRQDSVPNKDSEPAAKIIGLKPDLGTKDAPVDGLDGKPHKGPFVDTTNGPAKGKIPILTDEGVVMPVHVAESNAVKAIVEDGVMNDRNRQPPKKGTTGTEGGVSEKERDRKMEESLTQEKVPQKPPTVPQIERTRQVAKAKDMPPGMLGAHEDAPHGLDDVKPKGAAGLEKPNDLPDLPHVKPHIEAVGNKHDSSREALAPLKEPPVLSQPQTESSSTVDHSSVRDEIGGNAELDEEIPWDSFVGSFSSIAATEIGDKTFIVAALMAMRHDRFQVFTAAYSALFIMTLLSGVCGHAVGAVISKRWAAVVAALLFLVFGVKSLQDGFGMSPDQGVSEEMKEVEAELEEKEVDIARQEDGRRRASSISPYALEAGRVDRKSRSRSRLGAPKRSSSSSSRSPSPSNRRRITSAVSGIRNLLSLLLSPAWVETFSMTFVGELGDRSQIATVAMAAGQEYFWVMVGASLGHLVCTGVAVVGGSVLAGKVSMRKVTLVGGAIFIAFGIFTLFEAVSYWI